jgi:hypothetical protein
LLPTITALGDVVGSAWSYDSCDSCHKRKIAETCGVSIKYTVPRITSNCATATSWK